MISISGSPLGGYGSASHTFDVKQTLGSILISPYLSRLVHDDRGRRLVTADSIVHENAHRTYAVSVRRMTAESVLVVLLAAVVAITGFVVGATITWWAGVPIMIGSIPLWGWGCLANKTFYAEE